MSGAARPARANRQVVLREFGGPEKLLLEEQPLAPPARGEVQLRHTAIGLNFSDIYLRTGLYARPLPTGIGGEAAGVVEAVGAGVRGFKAGDRVGYMHPVPGSYAAYRNLPATSLAKLPAAVSDEQAAAAMMKGLTAWYLLHGTHRLKRGESIVVQAAAGGVGLILSQWARALGARVLGVVGSEAKAELARRHGCHQVLVGYGKLGERVRAHNKGRGVDVVYDGNGRDSFEASLDCLRPRGLMVSYGNASGPVPPFSPLELARRGSLYLTRPGAGDYLSDPAERQRGMRALFALLKARRIRVHIGQRFPLADAGAAQTAMEERRTVGSTVLLP